MMTVTKIFEFGASHFLTKYEGKCEKLHGHNYKVEVSVKGEPGENDLLFDFVDLKEIVEDKTISKLDHSHLNDLFENPTAEIISIWIWEQLKKDLDLYEIRLWETSNSFVTYRG